MPRIRHGTLDCKACIEIPTQQPPQISPKVAQVIVSSEFTVILPSRLSQQLWALVIVALAGPDL